jgi:hypothetical protein
MRRLGALLAALAPAVAAVLYGGEHEAHAAGPFVDAPLTLPPLRFSADVGVGFGTFQNYGFAVPTDPTSPLVAQGGTQVGWGMNVEAAVGLPFVGELGIRVGYRFGDNGIAADADHFARLFDPIVSEPGLSAFANPEIYLRGTVMSVEGFELALESRIIIPTDSTTDAGGQPNSFFTVTPGVPMRFHLPGFLRVDTGLWLPLTFDTSTSTTSYALVIPAQVYFQLGSAFVGPETGITYSNPGGGGQSSVQIPLGVAAGYTFAGRVDLKVQVRTEAINDSTWASQALGGGVGVGLRLP